ncbi:MAG: Uma2 family endonuclease [Armatimonadetes bacterium]|nr:Uma2 family endonuclease [Armatimonadota bacterium]
MRTTLTIPDPAVDREAYEQFYPASEPRTMPSLLHDLNVRRVPEMLGEHRDRERGQDPPGPDADIWCAADVNCYWNPQEPTRYLRPDVLVGRGVRPDRQTVSYRLWDHGPAALVVEVASPESWVADAGPKAVEYAQGLCPVEYLYVNPTRGEARLYRIVPGDAVRVDPDDAGMLWSTSLGVGFRLEPSGLVRVYDRQGVPLPDRDELSQARLAADQARAAAEQRRVAAEQARAAAEQARAAAEQAQQAAEQAQQAAERERAAALARADAEAAARSAVEAELARLRAQLVSLTGEPPTDSG